MKTKYVTFLLILFFLNLAVKVNGETLEGFGKIYPLTEIDRQPGFKEFYELLIGATKRKDKKFINDLLDNSFRGSFGDSPGKESFFSMWNLDNPNDKFWTVFQKTILLGAVYDSHFDQFIFPYISIKFPDSLDIYDYGVITKPKVPMYREIPTDKNSKIIGFLSYDILKYTENPFTSENKKWLRLGLKKGIKGYVESKYVRSPLDFRAAFKKKGNKWVFSYFLAGD